MTASAVPVGAKQGAKANPLIAGWVEALIWTDRMVSALVNGVEGGKWYSLMDKGAGDAHVGLGESPR